MATKTELEIVIGIDGKVRMKTSGLKGAACITETESLEKLVGRVKGRQKTSEFYQEAAGARNTTTQKR